MKKHLPFLLAFLFFACDNSTQPSTAPFVAFEPIDQLLSNIAEPPQRFSVSSDKTSIVTGEEGTIIYVNPDRLETIDGSPLEATIDIELLEMTNKTSLMLHNAPTMSDGQLLETGGAYYINMASGGKLLKIKEGNKLEVEFPKSSKRNMTLFTGDIDSVGQINWKPTKQRFVRKDIAMPPLPQPNDSTRTSTYGDDIEDIIYYISSDSRKPLTPEQQKEYERAVKEYKKQLQTYEAIELLELGWINCDRFINQNPKADLRLLVNNDTVTSARLYAIFKDMNSIMMTGYHQGMNDTARFVNIPVGQSIDIIALTTVGETPFIFTTSIVTKSNQAISIDFSATTLEDIKKRLSKFK